MFDVKNNVIKKCHKYNCNMTLFATAFTYIHMTTCSMTDSPNLNNKV